MPTHIHRIWRAFADDGGNAYREHFAGHVVPTLERIEGFIAATLVRRTEAGTSELIVTSIWQSMDAIKNFAGEDVEQAVVATEARACLTDWERRVRHYELVCATASDQQAVGSVTG